MIDWIAANTWWIVNITTAALVAMIVAYKMGAYPEQFLLGERIGMGMIATGMVLRIGPILGKNFMFASPFDDWSVTMLHVGLAVYFVSRLYRVHRHWCANEKMKEIGRRHAERRVMTLRMGE